MQLGLFLLLLDAIVTTQAVTLAMTEKYEQMLISSLANISNRDFFRSIISIHVLHNCANFASHATIILQSFHLACYSNNRIIDKVIARFRSIS